MRRFFGRVAGGGSSSQDPYSSTGGGGGVAGNDELDPYRTQDYISVKHGQTEHRLTFPVEAISSHNLTVGTVREKCAQLTGVDYPRVNLVCAGKSLKDDAVSLKSIGVENGAKILCMGSKSAPPSNPSSTFGLRSKKSTAAAGGGQRTPSPLPESKKPPPLAPLEKIEDVRNGIMTSMLPLIENFNNDPPSEKAMRETEHRRLSETVMGELLKLDSVESSDPDVRARRKEVVREVQKLLDSLDKTLKGAAAAAAL